MSNEANKNTDGGKAVVHTVELLSTSVGKIEGEAHLLLALRLDPTRSFGFTNYAITAEQAKRLHEDLSFLLQNSPMLNEPAPAKKPARKRKGK